MDAGKNWAANPLRVMELFAGVGGFRLGLNQVADGQGFEVVWSNQYEPGRKAQHAAQVYQARWGQGELVNRDIFAVLDDAQAMASLDQLAPEMLVGGFPCQDYSVAKTLSQSAGLEGKKGVLWWAIHRLLSARQEAGQPVKYLMLENVDRLLASPAPFRGRDFAIMLASLQQLRYAVEWRVVDASAYGFPQRRKRVFILGYHRSTPAYTAMQAASNMEGPQAWMTQRGPLARALPCTPKAGADLQTFTLGTNVLEAQASYAPRQGKSRFLHAGVSLDGQVWTQSLQAEELVDFTRYTGCFHAQTLGHVVAATPAVPPEFFIPNQDMQRWFDLKGAKSLERVSQSGHSYRYSEGRVPFPDPLDRPSRTIITSEGGATASRTKHAVRHADGRLRRLTPEELEVLNGFPRGFTAIPGVRESRRAFLMGNALVVGLVQLIGTALLEFHHTSDDALTAPDHATPGAEYGQPDFARPTIG